jgi:hypothetical protein
LASRRRSFKAPSSARVAIIGLVPAGDPKHPLPFAFRELTDDEFDELVYLVAHVADPSVVKTRAPDGGLDTVRLAEDDPTRATWGIQAKLHREQIKWPDCKKSLDRAVEQWKTPHVTFAFPRDLTQGQHSNHVKHLVGRHAGVKVDWWGATKLTAVMTGSDAGRAIARRFFHAEDPADVVDRALRAGGPLRTPADLLEREGAIGDFLRTASPHFDFHTTRRPTSHEAVAQAPNAAMRLEFADEEQQLFVDMVPRTAAALEHYGPKGSFAFKDHERAVALLDDVQRHGGRATLGEATVRFDRIPPPFDELLSEFEGVVSVRAEREAQPWAARITAETDEGKATLDLDLAPAQAEPSWDAKLVGQRHGVTVELRFVWRHDDGVGTVATTWRLTGVMGSVEERAQALAVIVALHGEGTFAVTDRDERRPAMILATERRSMPDGLRGLRDFYRNLAEIEAFAGKSIGPPPEEFGADDVHNVAYLAHLLRRGRLGGTIKSGKVFVSAEAVSHFRRSGNEIEIRDNLMAKLFGRDVHVADRVLHLPPMQVRHATRRPEGVWEVELVPVAGDEARMETEFRRP